MTEIREGRVGPLLPQGLALVRGNTENWLVANAIPGDRVHVQPVGKRRGVRHAALVACLEPGPDRVQAVCPVADVCGGCALQFLAPKQWSSLKSSWVKAAYADCMDTHTQWLPVASVAQADSMQRRRVRWHVGHDEHGFFLGFMAHASHQVVRQTACMMQVPALNALKLVLEEGVDLSQVQAIQAVQLHDGLQWVLEQRSEPSQQTWPTCVEDWPVQGWWQDPAEGHRPLNRPVQVLHDRLPAANGAFIDLAVAPGAFVQGQQTGNHALVQQILDWSGPVRRVVDLFSGIGNLSLPLAAAWRAQVAGAELSAASVAAANANARRLGLSARYRQANLFMEVDDAAMIGADLLLLDPPRRGARKLCENMHRLLPQRIISVACDPAAGARDGQILRRHGYRLQALRALDLFPAAGHVEALALWCRPTVPGSL